MLPPVGTARNTMVTTSGLLVTVTVLLAYLTPTLRIFDSTVSLLSGSRSKLIRSPLIRLMTLASGLMSLLSKQIYQ
jgi:hypothetical protein